MEEDENDDDDDEDTETPSSGKDTSKENVKMDAKDVRAKSNTASRATTKRRLCSTSYSLDLQLEEYLGREESMSVEIKQLQRKKYSFEEEPGRTAQSAIC